MNCPYCHEEMKRGKIWADGRSGIRFYPENPHYIDGRKYEYVAHIKSFGHSRRESYKCEKCGAIITRLDGEENK